MMSEMRRRGDFPSLQYSLFLHHISERKIKLSPELFRISLLEIILKLFLINSHSLSVSQDNQKKTLFHDESKETKEQKCTEIESLPPKILYNQLSWPG